MVRAGARPRPPTIIVAVTALAALRNQDRGFLAQLQPWAAVQKVAKRTRSGWVAASPPTRRIAPRPTLPTTNVLPFAFSGVGEAFTTILVSEIGDKTFFLTMILSARRGRVLAMTASMAALWLMTMLSASIGFLLRKVPGQIGREIWVPAGAAALMIVYGIQSLRELGQEACQDAKDEAACEIEEQLQKAKRRPLLDWLRFTVLIFLAEWGDRSMLTTVTLAATRSPYGVVLGGCCGHLVAALFAVASSQVLQKYISDRTMKLLGGLLFLSFGVTTLLGIY